MVTQNYQGVQNHETWFTSRTHSSNCNGDVTILRGGAGISKVVRPLQIKDHSCMCTGGGSTASSGLRHIASSCTSYTHVYLATRECRCSPVGPRRAPDPPAIERERLYEKRVHAGESRAHVGHLAQSSCPQTVSAVWKRGE